MQVPRELGALWAWGRGGGAKGLTILIHLVNHLLQLLRCGVLPQHPHHFAQLLGADAAVLCILDKDVKCSTELYITREK